MSPRVSLRDVDTRALQRELAARSRCVDCSTQHASGWIPLDGNRIRCAGCEASRGPVQLATPCEITEGTTTDAAATAAKGAETC